MFKPSKIFFYGAIIAFFFVSVVGGIASAKTINLGSYSRLTLSGFLVE